MLVDIIQVIGGTGRLSGDNRVTQAVEGAAWGVPGVAVAVTDPVCIELLKTLFPWDTYSVYIR